MSELVATLKVSVVTMDWSIHRNFSVSGSRGDAGQFDRAADTSGTAFVLLDNQAGRSGADGAGTVAPTRIGVSLL